MAMALKGKNNHYHWQHLQRRYFLETAKAAHYPVDKAEYLLNEMLEKTDYAITSVAQKLPSTFPKSISQPIFEGLQKTKEKLSKR